MKIDHIAVWSKDIETLKDFYVKYFNAKTNSIYKNTETSFQSYFLSFDNCTRLELMQMPGIPNNKNDLITQNIGLLHFAISVGSEDGVSELTSQLKADGYRVISEPRRTGDGYFESCIFDPDNNRIEITV